MNTTLMFCTLIAFASCFGQGRSKPAAFDHDRAAAGVTAATAAASATTRQERYPIRDDGAGIFSIGQKIPARTDCYTITESSQTRTEEGEAYTVPIYNVSEQGEIVLNIEPFFDDNAGQYSEIIGNIYILSDRFRTDESIGLQSTIEEFAAAYPDFKIRYSYVSEIYVIETRRLEHVQFFLDGCDFIEESGPDFVSDMTVLQASEFKKGSKIKAIRIFGYAADHL